MAEMFETPLRYESQKNRSHFKGHCNKKTDSHSHIATSLGKIPFSAWTNNANLSTFESNRGLRG